ncbi:MAG: nucleoside monophosphate kinase [Candidatus Berkelbacteria bacterium]|nr:nucleoside monophosphate kinase [Candidatus Berkelbacteria bacterium]
MLPNVIILLGGPASGKGTQAKVLAKRIGYTYFGTGDLMRAEVEKGTDLGKTMADLMNRGKLVPDKLTIPIVINRLEELRSTNIVLDGFPRNLDQAEILQDVFPNENFLVLNIEVSGDELLKRMSSRRICDKCGNIITVKNDEKVCEKCGGNLIQRDDDKPEVLTKRIQSYEEQTKPIIAYYREKGLVRDIDGQPPIEEVTKEIFNYTDF